MPQEYQPLQVSIQVHRSGVLVMQHTNKPNPLVCVYILRINSKWSGAKVIGGFMRLVSIIFATLNSINEHVWDRTPAQMWSAPLCITGEDFAEKLEQEVQGTSQSYR